LRLWLSEPRPPLEYNQCDPVALSSCYTGGNMYSVNRSKRRA
jgi:hypothetical protein